MDLYPKTKSESFQFTLAAMLEFQNLDNPDSLYNHQEFVRRYMSPYTPYRALILFHNLGSGKSIACIATAVDHYLYDRKECIIVTKGQSGTENFISQIRRYKKMCSRSSEWDESIFIMRRYISMSNSIADMSDEEVQSAYSNKILVLDEVHNIHFPSSADRDCVYNSILRLVKFCTNIKVLMATATPMTDNADQLDPLLHICNYIQHPNSPVMNSMQGIISYNPNVLDKPTTVYKTNEYQCTIHTLPIYISYMTSHQLEWYMLNLQRGVPGDIYRARTHLSLFCLPDGVFGGTITKHLMTRTVHSKHITPMSSAVTKEISYTEYSPNNNLIPFLSGPNLKESACKYSALIDIISNTSGNVFVFIEEVKGSGILLLSAILEQHGYELYIGQRLPGELKRNVKRYTLCVGSPDLCPNIQDRLDGFNSEVNKDGEYVRVLLGSRVIGESITINNVKQFHCITPHWNDSTINQAVGRVVRNGSHNALDPSKRNVDVYVHAAVFETTNPNDCIDIMKISTCHRKQSQIQEREDDMKAVAVDRYCIVSPELAPHVDQDCSTFCALYIKHHIPKILGKISRFMQPDTCVHIQDILERLEIHHLVLQEAMSIIIRQNIPIFGMYLRAYSNYVFLVDDCTLPYVVFPPRHPTASASTSATSASSLSCGLGTLRALQKDAFVQRFRYMPVKEKISLLEHAVLTADKHLLYMLRPIYVTISGIPCHLLWYRENEHSYNAMKVLPTQLECKTRAFTFKKRWQYVNADDERRIFAEYKAQVDNMLSIMDKRPIYGIISTMDGKMRIREPPVKTDLKDGRYYKRGRTLESQNVEDLRKLIDLLELDTNSIKRPELMDLIEKHIIDNDLYCII